MKYMIVCVRVHVRVSRQPLFSHPVFDGFFGNRFDFAWECFGCRTAKQLADNNCTPPSEDEGSGSCDGKRDSLACKRIAVHGRDVASERPGGAELREDERARSTRGEAMRREISTIA